MKLLATLLLLGLWSATLSDAYFYVPNFMSSLPFQGGSAFAQRGSNSIVIFGGENGTTPYTNGLYQLQQTGDTFTWQALEQQNPPPGSTYGQAIVSNTGSTFLLMGGLSQTQSNQSLPLQMYSYNFDTKTWGAWGGNTNANASGVPLNRQRFTATYDNNTSVYIYAGVANNNILGDFYKLDTSKMQFTKLSDPGQPRYGHTASILR